MEVEAERIDATKKVLDAEGWLDTGDVACLDDEGFLYIKDRREWFTFWLT
jgi:long-subunit acyl-CoA synthetase (AMP-forming)